MGALNQPVKRNNQHLVLDMRFKIANLIYDGILQY